MERNQLGCALVKIYYVALAIAVPKFTSLFYSCTAISDGFAILNTVLFSSYLQMCNIVFDAHYHVVTEFLLQSYIATVRHKNQY